MADVPKIPGTASVEEWSQNKRFIRTYASDTAALRDGTAPAFTPESIAKIPVLVAPQDALTRAVEEASIAQVAPAFDPLLARRIPEEPTSTSSASERLIGGSSIVEVAPVPTPPPVPAPVVLPPSTDLSRAEPLHTYASDFNQAVTEQRASPTTILAAEQDSGRRTQPVAANGANRYFIIGAVALIALGIAGTYAAYLYAASPHTVAPAPISTVRIFVDETAQIQGTGHTLMQEIAQSVATPLTPNAVRLLTLGGAATSSVFSALEVPAPAILLRNLAVPGSIAGVVNVSGAQSTFFILASESYSNTFYGMLSWEGEMQFNLSLLYPLISTTPSSGTFEDEVVDNHDARVLKDTAGNTLLIYGYFDQATLIIARNEDAFTEIVGRLANSHTQQG